MSLYLLHLTSSGLSAHAWQRGRLHRETGFAADDVAGFVGYLAARPQGRFRLLLDVAEESLATERIPRLRNVDRQTLVALRLARRFPGSELNLTLSLERDRDRENILLASISPLDKIRPWLAALHGSEARIAGIHGCALLAGELRNLIGGSGTSGMLCTIEGDRLRQSYLVGKIPVLTRSLPLPQGETAGILRFLIEETERMKLFLLGQHLLHGGDPLALDWLAPAPIAAVIKAGFVERPEIRVIDTATAAHRMGLPESTAETQCSDLLLALLARRPPQLQYAPVTLRRVDRLHRLSKLAHGIGLASMVAGLGFAAWTTQQVTAMHRDAIEQGRAAAALDAQRRILLAERQAPGMPIDELRSLLTERERLLLGQRVPDESWPMLGRVLDRHPEIMLEALDWKNTEASGSSPGSMLLRGRLRDASTKHAVFLAFADELALEPELDVRVVQPPTRTPDGASPGQFSLDIHRRRQR